MAGNFQCPQGQICSDEYGTAVGSKNTNLFVRTSTAIQQGSGTQVTGGTTTLYTWVPDTTSGFTFGTGQGSWKPAASSTDGKNWTLLKDSNGKNVLGTDAANSLLNPNGNLNKNVAANTTKTLQQKGGLTQQQSQTVVKSNAATIQEQQDQSEGNPQDFNQTLSTLNPQISDKKGGVRQSYGNYQYPIDAKFGLQDCIKFSMYRYKPKKVELTSDLGVFSGSNKGSSMGTVTLPIQPGISDLNPVQWGESSLDAIKAAGSAIALAAIKGGAEGAAGAVETAGEGIKDYKGDISKAIAASFAGAATGANQEFLTRATGAVLNNNLELLFQGPSLRSFTFNFSLSAREQKEAEMIRKIIRFFKQGMSVKRSESSLFLQTPNIFDIQYLHKGKPHPYINQVKTCALQSCIVNYTPAGNYSTYEDGAMTQYDITLSFGEIEPLFDDDYTNLIPGGDSDTHIGF